MEYDGFFDWLKKNIQFFIFCAREGEAYFDEEGNPKTRGNLGAWIDRYGLMTGVLLVSVIIGLSVIFGRR